jgi:hypothetical protein
VARNMFEKWCNDNGRMDLFNSTPENKMGGHIAAVEGFELLDLKGGRPIDQVTGRQGQRRWLCVEFGPKWMKDEIHHIQCNPPKPPGLGHHLP